MDIEVYGLEGKFLGLARSFGAARRMQEHSLSEDLRGAYAGISPSGGLLFYTEMLTDEQMARLHPVED